MYTDFEKLGSFYLGGRYDLAAKQAEEIKPKKTDISVSLVVLAWAPHFASSTGEATQAW